MKPKLSILITINNKEKVEEDIKRIIIQNKKANIEIILIDKDTTVTDLDKLLSKYSNIKYIKSDDDNNSNIYNKAIQASEGEYVAFIEQGEYYSKNAIKKVYKYIKKEKAKIIAMKSVYAENNIQKKYKICPNTNIIDLKFMPQKINLVLESYFFNKKLVENISFDNKISIEDAKMKLLLTILCDYQLYYLINDEMIYYFEPKENDAKLNKMQYEKSWYVDSLEYFMIPFLHEIQKKYNEIPKFVQEAILYLLTIRYKYNLNESNKEVLSENEAKDFFEKAKQVLKYIDNDIIMCRSKKNLFNIPRWLSFVFAESKSNNTEIRVNDNKIELVQGNDICIFSNIETEHINVYAINYNKNELQIDCTVSVQDFLEQADIELVACLGEKRYYASKTQTYPLQKCFGLTIAKKTPFTIVLPVNGETKKDKIQFFLKYRENEYLLKINFAKIQSHLSKSKYSYWRFGEFYLTYGDDKLLIEKQTALRMIKREIIYNMAKLCVSKNKLEILDYILLRIIYWIMYPCMKKKRIWIYFDKIYKAGDNAEYLYNYAIKQNDGILHYYIINKESLDYKRLKKEKKKILIFGSTKLKLYSLYAEAILATHKNVISFLGFPKSSRKFFQDLFNPNIICIQHGLTMQSIAQHQNRWEDNTKLYMCASKYEIENLKKGIYGYDSNSLKLVGLARFDGLINKDKRQIFIAPTWRKNAANTSTRMGSTREYIEEFKNTKYFEIFNSIITNTKLINEAKKHNYKIIFLLHPVITAQEKDFDHDGYVQILTIKSGISYEQLLTESSLMVTDYSGIQYDFAYMRKALIYFHPDELPAQYEDGGINYETMGFGPICKTKEDLIVLLCKYMANNCKPEEKYIKRADDFFAFNDHNNCKRIYNEVKKYLDERK